MMHVRVYVVVVRTVIGATRRIGIDQVSVHRFDRAAGVGRGLGDQRRRQVLDSLLAQVLGKTLIPQPHLRFGADEQWTLDDVRGNILGSPLKALRGMSPADREKHLAEYRAGFTITPFN